MAASYYLFTELSSLGTQTSRAFGDIATNGGTDDLYRVDSWHPVSADAGAYAICDGIVMAQPATGSANHINLILKPTQQPQIYPGQISFIIYKGIKKSSLIDGNGDIAVHNTTSLTEILWRSMDAQNASKAFVDPNHTPEVPKQKHIGFEYAAGTTLIETNFFAKDDVQLPPVSGGIKIGEFEGGSVEAGIEIVFETLGNEATMDDARHYIAPQATVPEHLIKVAPNTGIPLGNQADRVANLKEREKVLTYMDVAALYGSQLPTREGIIDPALPNKTSPIRHMDLKLAVGKFLNKNKIYIDIRNQFGNSFNYYQNQGDHYQIDITDTGVGPDWTYSSGVNYYEKWPILALDISAVANVPGGLVNNLHSLWLSVQNIKDWDTTLYSFAGHLAADTLQGYRNLNYVSLPSQPSTSPLQGYTASFRLDLWTETNESIGVLLNPNNNDDVNFTANYVRLVLGKDIVTAAVDTGTNLADRNHYLEYLFPISDFIEPVNQSANTIITRSYKNGAFVDRNSAVMTDNRNIYPTDIGIAFDNSNVTLYAYQGKDAAYFARDRVQSYFSIVSTNRIADVDFLYTLAEADAHISWRVKKVSKSFVDINAAVPVTIEEFEALGYETDYAENEIKSGFDPDKLTAVVLTKQEFQAIKLQIANGDFVPNSRVFLNLVGDAAFGASVIEEDKTVVRAPAMRLVGIRKQPQPNDHLLERHEVDVVPLVTAIDGSQFDPWGAEPESD